MRALFPGSFNPITLGHLDIIQRAKNFCDTLVVVVSGTRTELAIEQRLALVAAACAGLDHVEVISHTGLLVDVVKDLGAEMIIRGVRASSDLGYEHNMANMNRSLGNGVETILLPTSHLVGHISASLVRQIIHSGGNAKPFLPEKVWHLIQEHHYYGA
jgi:pantetheine-phosphate adenylyltransferase